ncbi:hypothetical protein GGF32_008353 [Allomyces javanicus]|nr:hypothetical protein GGF32_008353 [Allomyces javanicus]
MASSASSSSSAFPTMVTISANAAGPLAISRGHKSIIGIGKHIQYQVETPGLTVVLIKAATTRGMGNLDMSMTTYDTTTRDAADDARLHRFLATVIAPGDVIIMVGHGRFWPGLSMGTLRQIDALGATGIVKDGGSREEPWAFIARVDDPRTVAQVGGIRDATDGIPTKRIEKTYAMGSLNDYVPHYLERSGGLTRRQVWGRVVTRGGRADAEVFVDGMLVTTHKQGGLALFSVYDNRIGTVQWFDTRTDIHVSEKLQAAVNAVMNERELRVSILVAFDGGFTQNVNDAARQVIRHVFNVRLMRETRPGDGFCALVRLYERWRDWPNCAVVWMPTDTPVPGGISRWVRFDL